MDQIQRVKLRYVKLNEAVKEQDKTQAETARMRIDKEATERIVRNALGSQQIREDEKKRNKRLGKNLMSDSDGEDNNEGDEKTSSKPN